MRVASTDLIFAFFIAHNINARFGSEFPRVVFEVCTWFPNAFVVIFGDFYHLNIDCYTLSVSSSDTQALEFLDSCFDFSLCQPIKKPKRCSTTSENMVYLDLTFHSNLFTDIANLDGISGHKIFTRYLTCSRNKIIVTYKHKRCFNHPNFDEISAKLSSFNWEFLIPIFTFNWANWIALKMIFQIYFVRKIPVIPIKNRSLVQ